MRPLPRLAVPTMLAIAVACGDSSGPARPPRPAELPGIYQCAEARAFYYNPNTQAARWRTGSCGDWIGITNPSRRDSIDTMFFRVRPDGIVDREVEWVAGRLQYDSTTGIALVAHPNYPTERFVATKDALTKIFPPADYTGDGRTDTVQLRFVKVIGL